MRNAPAHLVWPDFVYALQECLRGQKRTPPAFIVGGAVRDAYLRRPIIDMDIAVDGHAVALARRVADGLDGDIFVMDKKRDVARVFADGGMVIDFARFRGAALEDDLRDRDFTINAMAADLLGDVSVLIDPLDGRRHLQQKVLRRCSPQAIQTDPIRALRAIRLSDRYRLKIHPDTLSDIRGHARCFGETSAERIRDEFFKLLALDNPARALRVLQHLDMLKVIIPRVDGLVGMAQPRPHRLDVWRHTLLVVERMSRIMKAISRRRTDSTAAAFDLGMLAIQFDRYRPQLQRHLGQMYGNARSHQELLVLAALIHNLGKSQTAADHVSHSVRLAKTLAKSLRLTADEGKKLAAMIGGYRRMTEQADWSALDRHRFWRKLGESGVDVILLGLADFLGMYGAELEQGAWLERVEAAVILLDSYFHHYDSLVDPRLLLNGNDIKELLDMKSGPAIGGLLTALREAQAVGDVKSVGEARALVRRQFRELHDDGCSAKR